MGKIFIQLIKELAGGVIKNENINNFSFWNRKFNII
jgi:hypothetical protein